jgi:phosphate transport system permease protein
LGALRNHRGTGRRRQRLGLDAAGCRHALPRRRTVRRRQQAAARQLGHFLVVVGLLLLLPAFVNDVLLSAPSIIVGLFVYELMVVRMGHFSAIAGAVALAVIAIPVTVRTTEDMINLIPQGMKDASTALGVHHWRTVTSVIYPAARSGIVTGLLLAVARISGETAPLLFTALNNQFWSTDLNAPMANLPVVIFQFALSPYQDWQQLAWSGALLITVTILLLSIAARTIVAGVKRGPR